MELILQECSRSLWPAGRSCGVVSRRRADNSLAYIAYIICILCNLETCCIELAIYEIRNKESVNLG